MPKTLLLLLLLVAPALSQSEPPLQQRARQMAALLAAEPVVEVELFDPAFLQAVPPAQLRSLGASLHAACGAATDVALVSSESRHAGRFEVGTDKNFSMPITLTIAATPPYRVVGLWFGQPTPRLASLDEVVSALASLPGQVSFQVARLGDDREPEPLAAHGAGVPLALGSAFKLWILATLAQDVREGARRWDEVTTLRPELDSLPSGRLQEWPDGAPLTLHTLATAMISESDNTATDHLLHLLGRERIESRLTGLGVRDAGEPVAGAAPHNRPLLSTAELFRLKLSAGDEAASVWLALRSEEARRRYLAEELSGLPLQGDGTDPAAFAKPAHVDTIEWFASAADLVRTLDALRRLARPVAGAPPARDPAPLLGVLSVNPGLPVAREAFAWAGFKGGSEPGVLCLAWLLQARDGVWYAVAGTWNDTAAALDEARFTGLLTRALQLLAATPR